MKDLGKLKDAELSYRKAIELKPNYAEAHYNLGNLLYSLDKLQEAELSTRKAIELKPDCPTYYVQMGLILLDLGKLLEAEEIIRQAIKIKPDNAYAYFNLSIIELLNGNYESGLEHYEFRWKGKDTSFIKVHPIIKRIDNAQLEKGEKLLVVSQQGLGDTLQFMRYIPYIRNQGIDVSFHVYPQLHSLILSLIHI